MGKNKSEFNTSDVREFRLLNEAVKGCDGWQLNVRLRTLDRSIYVLMGNHHELVNFLNNKRVRFDLPDLVNKPFRDRLDEFNKEVTRLFLNYLSASSSLIDHSRYLAEKLCNGNDNFKDYQRVIRERFVNSGLHDFMKRLRNLTIHRGLNICFTTTEGDYFYSLDVSQLLTWDDWTSRGRVYLKECGKHINLLKVVSEYTKMFEDFHKWFRENVEEWNSKELAELKSLQGRLKVVKKRLGIPIE